MIVLVKREDHAFFQVPLFEIREQERLLGEQGRSVFASVELTGVEPTGRRAFGLSPYSSLNDCIQSSLMSWEVADRFTMVVVCVA